MVPDPFVIHAPMLAEVTSQGSRDWDSSYCNDTLRPQQEATSWGLSIGGAKDLVLEPPFPGRHWCDRI